METKKRGRPRKAAKITVGQPTLKDMFASRTSSQSTSTQSQISESVDAVAQDEGAVVVSVPPVKPEPSVSKALKPAASTSSGIQPTRMFAIFEKSNPKPSALQSIEIPNSPSNEVIEISGDDLDVEVVDLDRRTPVPKGSSQEDPIIVEPSPVRPVASSSRPTWSIFQRKTAQSHSSLKGKQKASEGISAPYPEGASQHVYGPQSSYTIPDIPFGRRERPAHVASSTYPPESLHHILRCDSPYIVHEPIVEVHSGEDDTYIETIPRPHRRYPAVARSLRRAKNPTSQVLPIVCQEAWTEKWRPRRADEVIGNEERALYLREWLVSLRLQMTSGSEPSEVDRRNKKRKPGKNRKPEIVRHVKKKRKTGDGLADFLASDDEESIHDFISGADEDDFEFCQRMQDRIGYSSATTPDGSSQYSSSALSEFEDFPVDLDEELPFSFTLPNFGSRIHNTILLAGPPGCGKTAAVYACAEELGWEVFEVYPGIGERSGPELNKLVGDIGKNHIVHSTLRRSPPRHHQYFSRGGKIERKSVIEIDSDDDQVLPIASNIDTNPAPTAEPTIKQSLVLIEEVDVLYNSDAGFWPAIISIIRDCRRPVVLTCNDISLVPWSDLPLQTTLYFEPCPSPLATSYLQACCLSEKFAIGRDHIHCLFKGALPGASGSVDARGVSPFDLRFAINQLQYLSTVLPSSLTSHTPGPMSNGSESKISHPISTSHHTLQTGFETRGSPRGPILRLLDSLSYMEGQLSRDPSYFTELHSEATSLLDAELGYTVLPLELVPHLPLVSAFYTRDYSISQEFLSLSGRGIQTDYSLLSRLDEDTSNYMAQVNQVFVQCLPSTLSSSTALFTDYLPWIRHMVSTDNAIAMDELVSSSGMQSRRQTRTSRKAAQERYVPLENAELDVLSKTAFRMDWG